MKFTTEKCTIGNEYLSISYNVNLKKKKCHGGDFPFHSLRILEHAPGRGSDPDASGRAAGRRWFIRCALEPLSRAQIPIFET